MAMVKDTVGIGPPSPLGAHGSALPLFAGRLSGVDPVTLWPWDRSLNGPVLSSVE